MRIVKRHAGGPENQVINFFRPNKMGLEESESECKENIIQMH